MAFLSWQSGRETAARLFRLLCRITITRVGRFGCIESPLSRIGKERRSAMPRLSRLPENWTFGARPLFHDLDGLGDLVLAAHVPGHADFLAGLNAGILEGLGQLECRSIVQNKAHGRSVKALHGSRGVLDRRERGATGGEKGGCCRRHDKLAHGMLSWNAGAPFGKAPSLVRAVKSRRITAGGRQMIPLRPPALPDPTALNNSIFSKGY
ncbi:hypothetical protein MPLDJ20_60252 [Mesorhizobium plurifarium]|uniref:Uncharacterized protein n=1 Tax=Mesorhizobium plurifarium TaxID=69974 RepID=A0A090GQ35_MESPL|nr:hypothetical protein MPLDJ20_60252 [Mesorhizobium plurifarium]